MTTDYLRTDTEAILLDAEQRRSFERDGYLILPGFLPGDLVDKLREEVDGWVDEGLRAEAIACCLDPSRREPPRVMELDLPAHAQLTVYPPLMSMLEQLMGSAFVFHHLHTDRQPPDLPGKDWHHDYEQRPQRDRSHLMVHALHYLDGLDDQAAPLVVLPGSHHQVREKTALGELGTDPIPGERLIDSLPAGSTVILHSALFHARRARSGGRPRYFTDASYCQVGKRWPPVKPYWREMLRRGRRVDPDGRWPELFAEQHFTEYVKSM